MTIRAVFFDFGGVLAHWDRAFVAAFEAEHGLPEGGVLRALYGTPGWRQAEIGALSVDSWFQEVDRALSEAAGKPLACGRDLWSRLWTDLDHAVIELADGLRATHTVGVLSNTTVMLEDHVLKPHGIHDMWHLIVNSARVGVAKPDARIYEIAAQTVCVSPAECVHIDDLEANVRGAEAAGFGGILYTGDFEKLAAALNALGVVR